MIFNGLRKFLTTLESHGELVRINFPVDPYLEITEIADRVMKQGGPALLFEKVKGSPFPLAINIFGSKERIRLAFGVNRLEDIGDELFRLLKSIPTTINWREKIKLFLELNQIKNIFPKTITGKAPCQEIIMSPPNLDLLPIITCWPQDGGPFITLPIIITKDPETRIRNCGMYRLQKFSSTTTGMHWQIHKDGRRIFSQYQKKGERMEVAVVLGGDPILTYAATAPLPPEVDELLFASYIKKNPIELVKGITIDLEVPAQADFVIEGYI
ncbi:MAG: UbiD family decarboxylase, partial [Desulfobacterota bacterium]|nr:UbiD family decarboxylase [Thermodesulfobacteriota bacterium]